MTNLVTLASRTWNRAAPLDRNCPNSSPLLLPRPLRRTSTRTRSSSSSRYSSAAPPRPSQAPRTSRQPSAMPARPVQLPGAGPSAITYSISGCAHSAELKSPRSQAAWIKRTRSTLAVLTSLSIPVQGRLLLLLGSRRALLAGGIPPEHHLRRHARPATAEANTKPGRHPDSEQVRHREAIDQAPRRYLCAGCLVRTST